MHIELKQVGVVLHIFVEDFCSLKLCDSRGWANLRTDRRILFNRPHRGDEAEHAGIWISEC